jgi:peptide/nickel transport system permease protein
MGGVRPTSFPFTRVRGLRRPHLRELEFAVSLGGVAVLVVLALGAPLIAPHDPVQQFVGDAFQEPGSGHLFGTDQVGRDVFSRVLYGMRLSLLISVAILALSLVVGLVVGTVAALGRGIVDEVLMRVTDVFLAVPLFILAMAIVATLGRTVTSLIIAMAVAWWPSYARLIRGQVLSIREQTFVDSARAVGNGPFRLAVVHLLPQTVPELTVRLTLDVGNVILVVSGLSFLGLGAQPPTPELGAMIGEARTYVLSAPWLMFFPGLVIVAITLCFSLLGDAMRER